jgi:hypothetical protein
VPASQPTHLSSGDSLRICPETGLRLWVHSFRKKCAKSAKSLLLMRWVENRKRNRRSLHCATPDFVSRLVALANFMRLSVRKAAHAAISSAAWQEIRVRSGRDDNSFAGEGLGPVSGGSGVSKLSKLLNQEDALSAPFFRALSQLRWPDKGREVWFSLGENHEKAGRFDLHQLRNCLRDGFCSPQARPRGAQECCGKA